MFIIFTENLKKYREKADLSKAELARLLGLKYNTYNNYEMGTGEPKLDILVKIANILNVSIDDLVGRTPADEDERLKKTINDLLNINDVSIKDNNVLFYEVNQLIKIDIKNIEFNGLIVDKKALIDFINKLNNENHKNMKIKFFKQINRLWYLKFLADNKSKQLNQDNLKEIDDFKAVITDEGIWG